MRISELSERTGVPVATIKYYVREGLLPAGTRTGATQATYDDHHAERLRMIRVLREVGDVPVARIGAVVAAVDGVREGDRPLAEVLATAHHALGPEPGHPHGSSSSTARTEVFDHLRAKGWLIRQDAPALDLLAGALDALRALGEGTPPGPEIFDGYADTAAAIAEVELASVDPSSGASSVVEQVIIGTVIYERALVALRRLAQEHHSTRRFGPLRDDATT